MTRQKRISLPKLASLLATLLLVLPTVAAAQPELFTFVDAADLPAAGDAADYLEILRAEPTTKEVRVVQMNFDLPPGADVFNLNVRPDLGVPLPTTRVEERAPGDYSWFGDNLETGDHAILVVNGDETVGTVRSGGEIFHIRPLGNGLHAIVEVDESAYPPEHPPEFERQLEDAALDAPAVAPPAAVCPEITVLVAYTPAAKAQAGNIDGLIQLAVDETNQAYGNSQIQTRLKLVHRYQTQYTEGDWNVDLGRFRTPGDGHMDEVHAKRDTYGADLAVLIRKSGGYCGLAYVMADESKAFSEVAQSCATGYYSFGHEIGHNQGCLHNPEVSPGTWPFPYGHGYRYDAGPWRTIMSYDCPGGCPRIKYFSNPDVTYGGVPMGTAATHDNARVIDETSCTMAGFRKSIKLEMVPLIKGLKVGQSGSLTAILTADGAPLPGATVQLASADASIASVGSATVTNSQGKATVMVKGKKKGTTTIKAAAKGQSAKSTVTVPTVSATGLLIFAGLGGLLLGRPKRRPTP